MDKDRERVYLYHLFRAPGMGGKTAIKILEEAGSAENAYREHGLISRAVYGKQREAYAEYRRIDDPFAEYDRLIKQGINFTALPLPDYPEKLKNIPAPPFGITWIGSLPDDSVPAVSVIGARQCSDYGRIMADRFGYDLAAAGIQVVSGMAVGIDGLSQSACIRAGGKCFALLGSGVDICYPKENRDLYEMLKVNGGVISENPPGTPPRRQLFPMRNRLISAFCDALLVIEARKRSGTLITVDMALEQGKDIFALPGRVTDALSDGCNQLIRQGAGIATCVSDISDALFGTHTDTTGEYCLFDRNDSLNSDERLLLSMLDLTPRSVMDISEGLERKGSPRSLAVIMELMMELCAKGAALQEGGYFKLRPVCTPGSHPEAPSQ